MTKKECAIVMAYTGVCMLQGDDFKIFGEYVSDLIGYPVYTHDFLNEDIDKKIKESSKKDFLELCKNATDDISVRLIDANELKSKAETSIETTDAFIELIDSMPAIIVGL